MDQTPPPIVSQLLVDSAPPDILTLPQERERQKTSGLTRRNFLTSILKKLCQRFDPVQWRPALWDLRPPGLWLRPLAASRPSWLIRAAGRLLSNSCGNHGSLRRLFIFAPRLQVVLFCNCNAPPPPPPLSLPTAPPPTGLSYRGRTDGG